MRTIGRRIVVIGAVLGTTASAANAAVSPPQVMFGATTAAFGPSAPPPGPDYPGGYFIDPQIFTVPVMAGVGPAGDLVAVRTRVDAHPNADYGFDFRSTVDVAGRPAGRAAFGPSHTVSVNDGSLDPALAAGPDRFALAFTPGNLGDRYGVSPVVAMGGADGQFGAFGALPLPADGGRPLTGNPAVALAGDGAAAVMACAQDVGVETGQLLLWARPTKAAAFNAPRRVGRCEYDVSLAADDRGGIVALWTGPPADDRDAPGSVVWVSERPRGGVFAPPRAISGLLRAPGNGPPLATPVLRVGPRGDALAAWNNGSGQARTVSAAVRPAGGRWSAPRVLTPPDSAGGDPAAAVNARGDMAVVWDTGRRTEAAFRRAGGTFGPTTGLPDAGADGFAFAAGLTAKGTTVVARGRQGFPPDLVARTPSGRWGPPQRFSPDGVAVRGVSLATDRAGNGTLLWSAEDGGGSTVKATVFTDARPRLTGVRLTTKAVHLRSSEPVRLTLTARAGRRLARQRRTQVKAGRTTVVRLTAALRGVLRHSGASVTVRVQDAGGGVASRRVRPPRRR